MLTSLRPATLKDKEFLRSLHRETLREYVEQTWGWDEEWQHRRFDQRFDPPNTQIIVVDGDDVGMLKVGREEERIFLENILIAPSHQRRGIGTQLIKSLIEEADERGVPIRLQVLKVNPVRRLYERLGFREIGTSEMDVHMERHPL